MKHQIKTADLIQYMLEDYRTYATSKGKGSDKELRCMLRGGYQVWDHNELVIDTDIALEAVNIYNELN